MCTAVPQVGRAVLVAAPALPLQQHHPLPGALRGGGAGRLGGQQAGNHRAARPLTGHSLFLFKVTTGTVAL